MISLDDAAHLTPGRWPSPDGSPGTLPEGRWASSIRTGDPDGCRVGLLGLPDDTGVRMNGGRPGAAEGPEGFRTALAGYGGRDCLAGPLPPVFDAGDVAPGATLEETHERVTGVTRTLLAHGLLPVAVGGGHDLTFPFVRAIAASHPQPLTGIYLDAHLDVRAEPGSGMPFRRLVEDCGVRRLHVFGLDPFSNRRDHLAWFQANGGVEGGFEPDRDWPEGPLFVSLDLDVLDQAHAPGVSAMNPAGWPPEQVERWCRAAGRTPGVACFDLMELAPPLDPSGRTARLAARLFLAFLEGLARRGPEPTPAPDS